ncbi:MAG TPA: metallophosphoesterase [Ktedonobacteraceae bacterium]|nr:metallophosphoesterase [Ktedonobacteraceae bacterium]
MDYTQPLHADSLLYFWGIGDLHFRDQKRWQELHTPRMQCTFDDLKSVWQEEGKPAFCVSPGDLVEAGTVSNYALVKRELAAYLDDIPFYPGIGNHEYHPEDPSDALHTREEFAAAWNMPPRYAWIAGRSDEIVCIMLDYPDAFLPGTRQEEYHVVYSQDTLNFLAATLEEHRERIAVIFAHCPLHATVLDRDPERNLDYDSLETFFFAENSSEIRAILARHHNGALFFSGHTHSGWGAPQLVFTERLGGYPVTHINLSSPWYTGRRTGARWNEDHTQLNYIPDSPDLQVTFSIDISTENAIIRARSHRERRWLARWEVPLR